MMESGVPSTPDVLPFSPATSYSIFKRSGSGGTTGQDAEDAREADDSEVRSDSCDFHQPSLAFPAMLQLPSINWLQDLIMISMTLLVVSHAMSHLSES